MVPVGLVLLFSVGAIYFVVREVDDRASGTQVTYPLEGFSSSPVKDGQFSLHTLSPTARLMRTLLLAGTFLPGVGNELNLDHYLRNGALAPRLVLLRTESLLFSANGRHGLPHSDMRASKCRPGHRCDRHRSGSG